MGVVFLMEGGGGGGVGPLRMGLDIELAIASTGLSLSQVKIREYIANNILAGVGNMLQYSICKDAKMVHTFTCSYS